MLAYETRVQLSCTQWGGQPMLLAAQTLLQAFESTQLASWHAEFAGASCQDQGPSFQHESAAVSQQFQVSCHIICLGSGCHQQGE